MRLFGVFSRGALVIYGVIAVAIVAGIATLLIREVLTEREIAGSLLTLLGTFVGALLAFRLNERKDELKIEKTQKQDLNAALFVLARQSNTIGGLHRVLCKFESDFERAINCPALRPPDYADVALDFGALAFILEKNPSLLLKLSLEEEGFKQALQSLKTRNDFYISEIQPAIDKLGLNQKSMTMSELEAALGERLTQTAFNTARVVYQLVKEANEGLPKLHGDLFGIAKELFPDAQFVRLAPRPEVAAA
jgi:hypothetical protein